MLDDELRQLKKLASNLSKLDIEWNDSEVLKQKVEPLCDDMLHSNLAKQNSQTISIIAKYLADIISSSTNQDIDKLSNALQEVMSPAISNEIENNKDKMIDALYPIMGGMISKYVTQSIKEMMETINQKIEDGLSFDKYKRKIKAKLTGVSEVELLLEESSDAVISSILIIHKETGLMIAEAHQENKELDDAVMVASMASAIKDFVNDWIQNQEENASEVQILSYGNATLYIESAGSVYMIAFMESEPDYEQRKEINQFFAKVLSKYSKLFHTFDGDTSNEQIPKLEEKLYKFLRQQKISTYTNTQHPNISKYILSLLLFGLVGYSAYTWYEDYKLSIAEQEVLNRVNTPIKLIYTKDGVKLYGYVEDMESYTQIEDILKTYNYHKIYNYLHIPSKYIDKKLINIQQNIQTITETSNKTISKLEQKITTLQKQNDQINNQLEMLKNQLTLIEDKSKQILYIKNIKKYILNDLEQKFKNNPFYHKKDGSLDFSINNLFMPYKTEPNPQRLHKIAKDYKIYVSTIFSDDIRKQLISQIIIEGYTDSSGNSEKNLILSSKRAEHIKEYLMKLDITKKLHIEHILISKGMGEKNPIIKNGIEDKNASRRIKIRFELDNNKILSMIKE